MLKAIWGALYPHLRWAALGLLILIFAQALPFDALAILFAGDMLTYLEIATAVFLAAQVTRLRWAAAYARFIVPRAIRRARSRARRMGRRIARALPSSSDDDGRGYAPAYA